MKSRIKLEGKKIDLRILRPEDVGADYLAWLRDAQVNQYLEVRHSLPSGEAELREFVARMYQHPDEYLFGIFSKANQHIGNIKLGGASPAYNRKEIGLFVGDRQSWGQGIAAESIGLVTAFAFDQLNLKKITAGAYSCNHACIKAFMNNEFTVEGTLKLQYRLDSGEWVDSVLLGKLSNRE